MSKTKKDTFEVKGGELVDKIKKVIKEGNVTKIIVKDKMDRELVVFPLTAGVVGAVVAPILAGIGAMAILVGECKVVVERQV